MKFITLLLPVTLINLIIFIYGEQIVKNYEKIFKILTFFFFPPETFPVVRKEILGELVDFWNLIGFALS